MTSEFYLTLWIIKLDFQSFAIIKVEQIPKFQNKILIFSIHMFLMGWMGKEVHENEKRNFQKDNTFLYCTFITPNFRNVFGSVDLALREAMLKRAKSYPGMQYIHFL